MSGRPIPERLTLAAKMLRGEDAYWRIIRTLDARGPWTVREVEDETASTHRAVAAYVRKLVKAGFARLVEPPAGRKVRPQWRAKRYRLAKSPQAAPRIRADGTVIGIDRRQCMWNAIRKLKGFTVRELAVFAALPDQPIREKCAQRYIELLAAAGYLTLIEARKGSSHQRVWRLKPSMNTGPLSPSRYKACVIFDRNRQELMGDAALSEEAA